ncbi:hypothetical protein [Staphylococcus epidermidis]|nr:hypothetical protein [Staphylococcus epidermidis]
MEELCGKSVSKSFVSSLTEQLELWLTSGRIVYYQKKIILT